MRGTRFATARRGAASRGIWTIAWIMALLVAAAGPSASAPAGKPATQMDTWAEARLTEAYALHQQGKYEQAIEAYRKIYARSPQPRFQLNIGIAYAEWGGHCAEMVAAFNLFERTCGECAQRAAGMKRWAALRPMCEGRLTIDTKPAGAAIEVDGKPRGAAPTVLTVSVGEHMVVARQGAGAPARRTVRVEAGGSQAVMIELLRAGPAVVVAPAAPPAAVAQTSDATTEPAEPGGSMMPWAWTALGVGAAGLATGVTFTVLGYGAADDANSATSKGDAVDASDKRDRDVALSWVGYGIGVAGLATGATLLLLDDEAPALTVVSRGDGAVVGWGGCF